MSLTQDIRAAFAKRDNALNQLIIINVLVFAVMIVLNGIFTLTQRPDYTARLDQLLQLSSSVPVLLHHPWTLLTYAFVHAGFLHIIFNMLNLYYFGQLIREYLGDRRLVSLYILGALVGGIFFLLAFNFLPVFQGTSTSVVGASAAVTAVIVAAATLLPDYTFMLFLIGPTKIKWIAAVVLLLSVAAINGGNPGGGIAHLGGALLGYVFVRQLRAGRDLGRPVVATGSWLGNLFQRRPAAPMKVTHRATAASSARPGQSAKATATYAAADEIDTILDKISRSGYESLSKEEKQKLFQASQQ